MVNNNNKKKRERKHSALNPLLRGKKTLSSRYAGITFQVPHAFCFTLEKGTQIKDTSFEDCLLPTTIICL